MKTVAKIFHDESGKAIGVLVSKGLPFHEERTAVVTILQSFPELEKRIMDGWTVFLPPSKCSCCGQDLPEAKKPPLLPC